MSEFQMKLNAYAFDFLGSAWPRRGVMAVLVLCLGLLVWSLVPLKSKSTPVALAPVTPQSRPSVKTAAEKAATAHLFGQSANAATDTGPAVEAAAITVEGVFYSDDKDMAWAILDVNGKSGTFRAGDALPDGEKLAAVGVDAVQIANGPALRVVAMPKAFGPASGIELQGVSDLYARQDSFPAQTPPSAAPIVQRMQAVTLPQGSDPVAQMRALREQLIRH